MNKPARQALAARSAFRLGPWRVNPATNTITRGGLQRHLENRIMQTLVYLAEHQGSVITRQQFFETVWHGRVVNEEALSRAISLLRTALDDSAQSPQYIQTVPGVGYRLIAEVHPDQDVTRPGSKSQGPRDNAIAVLPFINLSDDASNEYFSDGISEEILNVLTHVEHFNVVGRTSSFAFKNKNHDLREIGRSLNVSHVLEGSVRKAATRVRITAQLIDAQNGYHLWSESYDRELDDIFAVQDDIASAVVNALKSKLLASVEEPQDIGGTQNAEAYQAYLLGMHYRNRGALLETVQHAEQAFNRAIELDPGYAKAYAGLAMTLFDKLSNGYAGHKESIRAMDAATQAAIRHAPKLADAYYALSMQVQLDYDDPRTGHEEIATALELNPGSVRNQIEFARLNCHHGNVELSVSAARKALELDPISVFANHILGHVLYFGRRYEEAIPAFEGALRLDPHYPKPHYFIAMSLHWLGQHEAALEHAKREPLEWMRLTATSAISHRLGRIDESDAALAALTQWPTAEVQEADLHAQRGEIETALDRLDQAYELGDAGLAQLLVDPFLDPLRDHPRFTALLIKVGLADE